MSREGPSRAYLGGRSVPAKSLSTFTTELLALHGQNDQLRLMRPDEQRAALDRFVDVEARLARYRSIRDEWLAARRDLADRRQRARELALEADRLQFGLNEIDAVAPEPGEDDALVTDIRRLSELDALRERRAVRTGRAVRRARRGRRQRCDVSRRRGRPREGRTGVDRRRRTAVARRATRRRAGRDRRRVDRARWLSRRVAQRRKHIGHQAGPAG